jgi:Family of unknown function (DUF6459)
MSLRLVKVPEAAPPYDCEAHGAGCPAVRAVAERRRDLTQEIGPRPARDAVVGPVPAPDSVAGSRPAPDSVAGSRPAPDSVAGSGPALAGTAAAGPAGTGAAGPAGALPWQFAQLIVEIMAGLRPPRQIVGLTTDHARAQARRLAPLLASDRRPRIQRIVTSRPTARAVEMTVIVSIGQRSRALAMRWEHLAARPAAPGRPARPDRWLCTAIETG